MSQLNPSTENVGAGDQSWLGSRHGADVAKSVTLDPTAWTAKTSDGRLKSGEACAIVNGLAVPFNAAGSGGTDVLAGFLLTDQSVRTGGGNVTAPMVWHGRIILSKLPSTVTAAAAATATGQFTLEA